MRRVPRNDFAPRGAEYMNMKNTRLNGNIVLNGVSGEQKALSYELPNMQASIPASVSTWARIYRLKMARLTSIKLSTSSKHIIKGTIIN